MHMKCRKYRRTIEIWINSCQIFNVEPCVTKHNTWFWCIIFRWENFVFILIYFMFSFELWTHRSLIPSQTSFYIFIHELQMVVVRCMLEIAECFNPISNSWVSPSLRDIRNNFICIWRKCPKWSGCWFQCCIGIEEEY